MFDEMQEAKAPGKKPTHRIYLVRSQGDRKRDRWTEIGAIWPHKDHKGGSILFNMTPLEMINGEGRIVYRAV